MNYSKLMFYILITLVIALPPVMAAHQLGSRSDGSLEDCKSVTKVALLIDVGEICTSLTISSHEAFASNSVIKLAVNVDGPGLLGGTATFTPSNASNVGCSVPEGWIQFPDTLLVGANIGTTAYGNLVMTAEECHAVFRMRVLIVSGIASIEKNFLFAYSVLVHPVHAMDINITSLPDLNIAVTSFPALNSTVIISGNVNSTTNALFPDTLHLCGGITVNNTCAPLLTASVTPDGTSRTDWFHLAAEWFPIWFGLILVIVGEYRADFVSRGLGGLFILIGSFISPIPDDILPVTRVLTAIVAGYYLLLIVFAGFNEDLDKRWRFRSV